MLIYTNKCDLEKQLVEQLERKGLSFQQLKAILDDIESKHGGGETTVNVSKSGLRVLKCKGCHKSKWESEFKLNSINRRYRSCTNCVMRATKYRPKKDDFVVGGSTESGVQEENGIQKKHIKTSKRNKLNTTKG